MHLISTKEPTVKKPEKAVLLVLTSCNNELQLIVYLSPTFDDLLVNIRSHPIICQWRDVLPIAYTRKRLHLQPYKGTCGEPDSSSRSHHPKPAVFLRLWG